MPTATRSQRQASGISRKAPSRKGRPSRDKQPTDNWALIAGEDRNSEEPFDGEENQHQLSREASTTGDAELALDMNPLREMAERVGKEVEDFAEHLDRFFDSLHTMHTYDAVLKVVDDFQDIAAEAAQKLEADHRRERAQQLRKEWSDNANISTTTHALASSTSMRLAGSLSDVNKEKVQQQRKWQQEADLWDLFRVMLELHHQDRKTQRHERDEALAQLGDVHRYTSEQELWDRFLLSDNVAMERQRVKQWLEQTVDHQDSDVQGIVEELESKAGRGKGLWTSGWMHTRERIKHEKRLRAWPEPDAQPLPQLKRSDNTEMLITSLDPDASARQDRTMEKPDSYFERATWIACWEMLRRGQSWLDVSEWFQQRNEGWRAVAIGKGADPAEVPALSAWRKMCYLASQTSCSSDHEAAVYGLLGGSVSAVQKVCRSVDDHLYAHYSAYLVRQFEQWLSTNFPQHASLARQGATEQSIEDPERAIYDLLNRLRKKPATGAEAIQPMKIIQSYLIANDVGSLVHTLGYAISFTDQKRGKEGRMIVHLEPYWNDKSQNQPEEEVALDPQTLRMATHMSILIDKLTPPDLTPQEDYARENVIIAYIQTLRAAGKRDLIPLYASRLSKGAYIQAMSQVMQDITNAKEQTETLGLLEQYKMDIIFILNEQLGCALDSHLAKDLHGNDRPLQMLEPSKEQYHPTQRISSTFLPEFETQGDLAIVASLRWFNMIPGQWKDTFGNLSIAMRKCLVAGRLACALRIAHEFPYDTISTRKAYHETGKSLNPMEVDVAPSPDQAEVWQLLQRQSRTYYELCHVVHAIKALAEWRAHEAEYTKKSPKLSGASPTLKAAKESVDDAMLPILEDKLLIEPVDQEEAADLRQIRTSYIPELIIAYNTVLHAAGYLISRENLLESMELSVTIADDKHKLAECFTSAGRMREMVTSFAHTSKSMLVLKAEGRKWTSRKDRQGKDLGIWEVSQSTGGHSRDLSLS